MEHILGNIDPATRTGNRPETAHYGDEGSKNPNTRMSQQDDAVSGSQK